MTSAPIAKIANWAGITIVMPVPPINQVLAQLRERHVSEKIIERIARLNPNYEFGTILRGFHRSSTREIGLIVAGNYVRRMDVIRQYGRKAWDNMPRAEIVKDGRRKYVNMNAVLDKLWLLPQDHPARRAA